MVDGFACVSAGIAGGMAADCSLGVDEAALDACCRPAVVDG